MASFPLSFSLNVIELHFPECVSWQWDNMKVERYCKRGGDWNHLPSQEEKTKGTHS